MTRWFWSDHHFGHDNIIRFADRPFADVWEMQEFMIGLHNEYVKPEDHVYFLGDVTLRRGSRFNQEWLIKLIRRMHGHKKLFLGNHDHFPTKTYLEAGFEQVFATWRDEEKILYSHMPVHPGSIGSAIANCHGHLHQNDSPPPVVFERNSKKIVIPYVNVCVEKTAYRPLSLEELKNRIDVVCKDVYNGLYDQIQSSSQISKESS